LRRQPLDDEDGGAGSVDAEDQNEAPRRVVVRLCQTVDRKSALSILRRLST